MIAYLLFIYILGFFLSIPFILICIDNDSPVRDVCWRILFYPVWVIPIFMYFVVVLIYCFIMNKTVDEGFIDIDSKIGNWKIIKALERFYE